MKALLIIDMQVGSFCSGNLRYDADGVVSRINRLSAFFRYNAWPVIFIQHDGTLNHDFIPGSDAWQILPELDKHSADQTITKSLNDCFFHSDLEGLPQENAINELYITGCATDFCVDSTIRSAHTKGFDVHVVKDGHTTANRPGLNAINVIEHHNWIWENMIPNTKEIIVSKTSEIIRRLVSISAEGKNEFIIELPEDITAARAEEEQMLQQSTEGDTGVNNMPRTAFPIIDPVMKKWAGRFLTPDQYHIPEGMVKPTVRELQILALIGLGNSTKQIADKLFISINTVENHRRSLLEKLQVKNSMERIRQP